MPSPNRYCALLVGMEMALQTYLSIPRPPPAMKRLSQRKDGKVIRSLERSWSDGTHEVLFEPEAFVDSPAWTD